MTLFKKILLFAFMLAGFTACKDKWEDHTAINDQALNSTIMQEISVNPRISRFHDLLVKSGLDQVLQSSKSFTVWAPTNEALQNIDQDVLNDPERLRQYLGNHISYQQYFTHTALPASSTIKTLSGKNVFWDKGASLVDGATILEANKYAGNGVLHIVDAALAPRPNSWEFLNSSNLSPRQKAFMQSLEETVFVDSLAIQTGVDAVTGMPVYDPNTGYVQRNRFFERAYNISNEDSIYTFVMLTDEAFNSEFSRFRHYFATGTADSTETLTSWAITKDLAFRGAYTKETLPDTLVSRSGVKVHIDQNAIIHQERTSNGVVLVVNKLRVENKEKIRPIRVEGEAVIQISHPERAGNLSLHLRRDPNVGENYRYVRATGHSTSGFWLRYVIPNVNSTRYKVYWRVINDFQTAPFDQRVAFKVHTATELPYKTVEQTFFPVREEIGEYSVERYGNLNAFLKSAMSTNNALNPLTLDYLELVPVF